MTEVAESESSEHSPELAEPAPEVEPNAKVLVLFDLNGTFGFQPRQSGYVEGSHVDVSEMPPGYRGFASRFYHRPHASELLRRLEASRQRCDWGFYTTKSELNAFPMAEAVMRHGLLRELGRDEQCNVKLNLVGTESWIWFFTQGHCEFISHSGEYEHGDVGGMWFFNLGMVTPSVEEHGYGRVIVVAGSERKLMNLPIESRLLCPDFVEAMVRTPEGEGGLLDVWTKLEEVLRAGR